MASSGSNFIIDDGIILWFDGPEWDAVAEQAFQEASGEVLTAAQRDAPWQDITGDARSGLETKVTNDQGEIVLTLYHTVDYGLWLEVIQNGHFATIMPTLERYSPKIMRNATSKIAKARKGR